MLNRFQELKMSDDQKEKKPEKNKLGFKGGPQKPDGEFDWSKIIKSVLSWGAVIIAAVIVMQVMREDSSGLMEVTYDVYEQLLESDKISEAKILKIDINDYILEGTLVKKEFINNTNIEKFKVTLVEPVIQEQVKVWREKGIKFTFVKESNEWLTVLLSFIPWILIIAVWVLFMKRMQGGGAGGSRGIFNFGKSKAKLITESQIKVTF
ncbi:MAG: cell division protein FtsH, partial [Melioribacteraceae bacterium]|nr:cell division protein FtsH [Melioribacteraceae bacterium]